MIAAKLDTAVLDRLVGDMEQKVENIISAAAFQVQAEASKRAPVDTGALRASIEAEKRGKLLWWVHDGTEYGLFVELGHRARNGRFIAAKPFLVPAAEKVRPTFERMIAELFK